MEERDICKGLLTSEMFFLEGESESLAHSSASLPWRIASTHSMKHGKTPSKEKKFSIRSWQRVESRD